MMAQCPKCDNGKDYSPQGLHGHLRMGHSLSGEELERVYRKGLDTEPTSAANGRLEEARAEEPEEPERGRESKPDRHEEPEDQRAEADQHGEAVRRGSTHEGRRHPEGEREESHGRSRRAPSTDRLRRSERPSTERKARERALDALDRLRKAKQRRKVAEEETEVSQSTVDRILKGTPEGDDVGICEACETEVEEAREEYREAVDRLREFQQDE